MSHFALVAGRTNGETERYEREQCKEGPSECSRAQAPNVCKCCGGSARRARAAECIERRMTQSQFAVKLAKRLTTKSETT